MPPVAPMLAKPVDGIPSGDYVFEPKWDGFRTDRVPRRRRGGVRQQERAADDPLLPRAGRARSLAELPPRCVIDGEIVAAATSTAGRLDFEALQLRLHPAASRVRLLAAQTPAHFVAFDLLALGDDDYTERPFAERRAALETALSAVRPPVHLTPATTDRAVAGQWFTQFEGAGLDGLIAKPPDGIYEPDKRVMFKIKHERTADCVVAGYRPHKTGDDAIGSLLLGLYNDRRRAGERRRDRRVPDGDAARAARRARAAGHHVRRPPVELGAQQEPGDAAPRAAPSTAGGTSARTCRSCRCAQSAWSRSATTTWRATRFRHTAQFVRWRPDRAPSLVHVRAARGAGQLQLVGNPGKDSVIPTDWS